MRTLLTLLTITLVACSGAVPDSLLDSDLRGDSDGAVLVSEDSRGGPLVDSEARVRDGWSRVPPCEADPVWTVTATGVLPLSYRYLDDCPDKAVARNQFVAPDVYSHHLRPNGTLDPSITVTIPFLSQVPSDKTLPLQVSPMPPITISIATDGAYCSNTCPNPPSAGTAVFSYDGKDTGSRVDLRLNGYLCCIKNSVNTWERFTYRLTGEAQ